MLTLLHSPTFKIVRYNFLRAIVHLIQCSIGRLQTLEQNQKCLLKDCLPLPNYSVHFQLHYGNYLNRARTSLQHTQKWYKNHFKRRFHNGCESIKAGNYMFLDISDGATKTPKLGFIVKHPFSSARANPTHCGHTAQRAGWESYR